MAQTLVVVEDDANLRKALRLMLESEGYTVKVAGNGSEALAIAREGGFDLAVIDIGLPDMSGRDVAEAMHKWVPGIAIVFLTGRSVVVNWVLRWGAHVAGPVRFLQKPCGRAQLLSTVASLLGASHDE